MKFDAPINPNYAAVVVRVPATIELAGLDNLVGVPVLGHQALTTRDVEMEDLRVCFTAETQLSHEYAYHNNLYRDATLNAGDEAGYLEPNRRVKAIKLRGHRSDALLMPLNSLVWTGIDPSELQEGDTFDTLDGLQVCRKYELPVKGSSMGGGKSKVEKAFSRVDDRVFPMHIDSDNYWRNKHLLDPNREVVLTQKLHGTSVRVGNVPVLRKKGRVERLINHWLSTADYEFDMVYGSRKVIKDVNNPNQDHWYGTDIWTLHGKKLDGLIPEGHIVYGELVGFTPDGGAIQKNYTYDANPGDADLYVYRVATVTAQGVINDLSWDGVREFCSARGLKHVPEFWRGRPWEMEEWYVPALMDKRYAEEYAVSNAMLRDSLVPLSHAKTVDEGVCLRQEGIVPTILKAKSPAFLQLETKLLDKGEADLESVA